MHYYALVLVKAAAADAMEAEVGRLLAPYHEEKWDWFQLGGRWTGQLSGYDPEADEANRQRCQYCEGTGTRKDMKVVNGCNSCGGTGVETKWPTQWARHDGDTVRSTDLQLPLLADKIPYALVTPDGEWFEKELYVPGPAGKIGEMVPTVGDWSGLVNDLLLKHQAPDVMVQVVDYHD